MTSKAYTWRKCIAVVIACVMTLSVVMTPAAAFGEDGSDDGRVVNLVALGNSMASGYLMPDYYRTTTRGYSLNNNYLEEWALEADGTTFQQWVEALFGVEPGWTEEKAWTYKAAQDWAKVKPDQKLARISDFSYPWRLKEYIANEEGVSKVDLTSLCLEGMRTDELRGFLDEDFFNKTSAREYAYAEEYLSQNGYIKTDEPDGEGYYYFEKYDDEGQLVDRTKISAYKGFFNERMRWCAQAFHKAGATGDDSYETACDYVEETIKNADVITIDLCNNNFGTYMGNRLSSFLGMYTQYCPNLYETIDDVDDVPKAFRTALMKIRNTLISNVPALQGGAGQQLLDIYLFASADAIVNHTKNIEYIRKINKDAKIIVVGMNNPMEGLLVKTGENSTIDFGSIAGKIYDLVDAYVKNLDKDNDQYYFAETPDRLVTFASAIQNAESLEALLNDGTYDEGKGRYSIDMMYDSLVNEYMGGQVDPRVKPIIQNVLYQALHDHKVLDINEITKSMSDLSSVRTALMQYVTDVMSGKEPHMDEGYWQLIHVVERYLLNTGVGEHPDADGWDQKYNAVLDAYLSDKTARDETKEEICNEIRREMQEIRQRIKEINDCMKETFSIKKIKEFVKELADLYKRLNEISKDLYKIKDTEELVDSFATVLAELETTTTELNEKIQTLETTSGELKKEAEELEGQIKAYQDQAEAEYARIAQLKAKSIWVDLTTKVTFPSGKVNVAVSWEDDEYADGFILKVNGAVKEPKKTAEGYIYEDDTAEVGKTYEFEVTPYLNYKGEPVYGVATKASVTPKVTVKKSAVKSLKKGSKSFTVKWKKVSGASGYQIRYKTGSKTVKKTVNGGSKTSLKVKNLKVGKKYTVKIRTWMKVNGKKYYSKWSAGKKVRVK